MVIAGIVAGGTGSRMGADRPKQFLEIAGKPILAHTVESFLNCLQVDAVVVGVHSDWLEYVRDILPDDVLVTAGGTTRNDTILRILEEAGKHYELADDTIILTHDAVRPFVSVDIIEENIRAAERYGVCTTARPAVDTIAHSVDQDTIADIPSRSEMFQIQTPQTFRYGLFRRICGDMTQEELAAATDVCGLFWPRGYSVHLVPGSAENFKITYPFDLRLAESLMAERSACREREAKLKDRSLQNEYCNCCSGSQGIPNAGGFDLPAGSGGRGW